MNPRSWSFGAAIAVLTATIGVAQTPVFHSNVQRYSDKGVHPATGRAGSASLAVRALLDSRGAMDVEMTTGDFDGAAPSGELAKAQIKLFGLTGGLLQTDNYNTAGGTARVAYPSGARGMPIQVQANVVGADRKRTGIVTVTTEALLRPDLVAEQLMGPPTAAPGVPITLNGVVSERNGDVGARGDCKLLVDGVVVDQRPGIWVDAGSTVTCQFSHIFMTQGIKQLELLLAGADPADYDASNNSLRSQITVRPQYAGSSDFDYFHMTAADYREEAATKTKRFEKRSDGTVTESEVGSSSQREHNVAQFWGNSSGEGFAFPLRSASARHTVDGVVLLEHAFVNVSPSRIIVIPGQWFPGMPPDPMGGAEVSCFDTWYTDGDENRYLEVCSTREIRSGSLTSLNFTGGATHGDATYYNYSRWRDDPDEGWIYNFETAGRSVQGAPFSVGSTYRAEISVTDAAGVTREADVTMQLGPWIRNYVNAPPCTTFTNAAGTEITTCTETTNVQQGVHGVVDVYGP